MPATALLDALQSIRGRVKRLAVGHGIGLSALLAVGLLLAMVLVDWALVLPSTARGALWAASLFAFGAAVRQWVLRPAFGRLTLSDVAGRVERIYPQFDDRLRSTVDFLSSDIPGSELLKKRVVSQATQMAGALELSDVVRPNATWISLAAGGSALLLLGALAAFSNQGYVSAALNRLALGTQPWPKSVRIAMDGDVPARVPVGQRVPIRVRLAKGDRSSRKAFISYRYDNGPWQQELMTRADGVYTAALDARIDQSRDRGRISVRIEAGDDSRELAPITVVPRLEMVRAEAEVLPPRYVKSRRASTVNLSEQPAIVGVGSEVAIRLAFNKPLAADKPVELRPASGQKLPESFARIMWDRQAESAAIGRLSASEPFRFTVHAVDRDGFANNGVSELELIVRDDEVPQVQIEEPRRSEERTPDAEFDIKAVAEDDYGIDNAQLVVKRLGEKNTSQKSQWVIDLLKDGAVSAGVAWETTDATPEHQRYRLQYHWALQSLADAGLKPGDVLEYFIQVKDNFDLNGKQHDWAPSGRLRVTIISHEQWDQLVQGVFEQTFAALKQIDQGQARNKGETDTLKQGVQSKLKFDEADLAQAQRLSNQQSGTAAETAQVSDRLNQLLRKMEENKSAEDGMKQTAAEVAKELTGTAEGPMRDAATDLRDATGKPADPAAPPEQQEADARKRSGSMEKSSGNQQKASEQVKAAMERLGNFGGLSEAVAKFQALREAQARVAKDFSEQMKANIGKKPEEMSQEDQAKAKQLSRDQGDLAKRTEAALDALNKKGEQLSKTDPTAAQGMKDAAQAGQAQQVPGRQSEAAQSMSQNQQAQAGAQHRQIELGLDDIINKLKETEKRKLEELARQLEALQKLVAELLQRQAGHNIDNLLLQGGQARLDKLDQQERATLVELSGRDPKNPAEAQQSAQLSASQEQTERNTRDIARQAEALPDPAPAAKLTAAGGQMERAIVHLRNNKLTDAYAPPQVEALRALADAMKAINDALAKASRQLQEQTEESIKESYVKLLEQQRKIGADIVRIDATPRDPGGDLPRQEGVRLGQMPGEQGKLAETAGTLGEKLESLGSVVYVWTNKDIIRTMNEVKEDLGKPRTDAPTQAEERRIEAQLQAMIDNLARKHREEKFASRKGGGGGGSGSKAPRMPGEAELRLLKSLQEDVRASTVTLNGAKVKDDDKLVALGGRQAELRGVFDQLLQKSAHIKLGEEPDNKDQLPEEASKEDVEDQEFDKQLRNDDLNADTVEKSVKLTGDRMARSRQRLALNNDPGTVTQEIQKRITIDLDQMIELAQQQQSSSKPGGGKATPGEKMGDPKSGGSQQEIAKGPSQSNHSSQPAQAGRQSTSSNGAQAALDLSKEIQESAKEWGGITARERQAVQEGASEKVIEKYKRLVDDYYRSLSEEATKR